MPRQKNKILQAQENYLATGNPAEVERMYRNLLSLGFYILARTGKFQDEDDVKDIAADICMKLMEEKKPVIEAAPSAYIKMALFYKKKKPRNIPEDLDSVQDEARAGEDLWDYISKVLKLAGLTESDSDSDRLARVTLESMTRWRLIYRSIEDPVLRKEYKQRMKEIEQCVRYFASNRDALEQ